MTETHTKEENFEDTCSTCKTKFSRANCNDCGPHMGFTRGLFSAAERFPAFVPNGSSCVDPLLEALIRGSPDENPNHVLPFKYRDGYREAIHDRIQRAYYYPSGDPHAKKTTFLQLLRYVYTDLFRRAFYLQRDIGELVADCSVDGSCNRPCGDTDDIPSASIILPKYLPTFGEIATFMTQRSTRTVYGRLPFLPDNDIYGSSFQSHIAVSTDGDEIRFSDGVAVCHYSKTVYDEWLSDRDFVCDGHLYHYRVGCFDGFESFAFVLIRFDSSDDEVLIQTADGGYTDLTPVTITTEGVRGDVPQDLLVVKSPVTGFVDIPHVMSDNVDEAIPVFKPLKAAKIQRNGVIYQINYGDWMTLAPLVQAAQLNVKYVDNDIAMGDYDVALTEIHEKATGRYIVFIPPDREVTLPVLEKRFRGMITIGIRPLVNGVVNFNTLKSALHFMRNYFHVVTAKPFVIGATSNAKQSHRIASLIDEHVQLYDDTGTFDFSYGACYLAHFKRVYWSRILQVTAYATHLDVDSFERVMTLPITRDWFIDTVEYSQHPDSTFHSIPSSKGVSAYDAFSMISYAYGYQPPDYAI